MTKKEINTRIASIRKLREYKQSDVAQFLGLKTSTYSQMERKGNITGEMILKLAEIFNVDPMIILCGENSEYEHVVVNIFDPEERKLTNLEKNIIKIFRNLNKEKQEDICDYISKLAKLGKYKGIKSKK